MSMYNASVPVALHFLGTLSNILKKAEVMAGEKKIEETVLTSARLAPDMFPLSRQIQITCDVAKGCGARLAGIEAPTHEDTETTFAELQARISKTCEFLSTLTAGQIDGSEAKAVHLKAGPNELEFTGEDYLNKFALPNMYFHITTAYNILRHNGVVIGKMDFLV